MAIGRHLERHWGIGRLSVGRWWAVQQLLIKHGPWEAQG